MRKGSIAAIALAGLMTLPLPARAFSCAGMHAEEVQHDPYVVSVVEARRLLSVPGLIPGVSSGRDLVEPIAGWGPLDDWESPTTHGSFLYPDCLDVSEADVVLIVERELMLGPILVDGSALTENFREALDTRFGARVAATGGAMIIPAVLAATWQWIAIAAVMTTLVVARFRFRRSQRVGRQVLESTLGE